MLIQLSSGQGPGECEMAVYKLFHALAAEYSGIHMKNSITGSKRDCFKSVLFESEEDLSHLEGSVLWICKSPFRPGHKRKNWYVDVSLASKSVPVALEENLVRFETFRSPGKGGQNVNKVETGVRAIYVPLGLSAESTQQRTQHMNKKLALKQLYDLVAGLNQQSEESTNRLNWMEHMRLERGNPVRIYEGMDFKRIQ